jgi:hypothetical protein
MKNNEISDSAKEHLPGLKIAKEKVFEFKKYKKIPLVISKEGNVQI